jgi:transposase InsO family protein
MKMHLRRVAGCQQRKIARCARTSLLPGAIVFSDGLACFAAVTTAGCQHVPIGTYNGRKAPHHPTFKWVNTLLSNVKTALTGTFHAIGEKHVPRYLAEFEYRFNRRFDLPAKIERLAHAGLYLVEDIFSRKIVGWEVHEEETGAHASQLIRTACLAEGMHEAGLALHSDNGGPMKAAKMLATLQRLGVMQSFSRPSVSDDNPYSESLFRTLKYTPAYANHPFESLTAAREWVDRFAHWYNEEHLHSGIRYVTPGQRYVTLRTPPMPQRLLSTAEQWGYSGNEQRASQGPLQIGFGRVRSSGLPAAIAYAGYAKHGGDKQPRCGWKGYGVECSAGKPTS